MSGAEPESTRASRVGIIAVVAVVVGVALLLIPPRYSSDVTGTNAWCGAPLFFDEDAVSRQLQQRGKGVEVARLIGAECHERVTGRIARSVLAGLVGVGALGIASLSRGRAKA